MAHILDLPNGRYRAFYRRPDGRQTSKTFRTKGEARRFVVEIEHRKLTGSYVDPSDSRTTFQTWAEGWRGLQSQHRPSTRQQIETNFRRHVYPILGGRPLGGIRKTTIQAWVRDRSAHLAPSTVELIYHWIFTVLEAAVEDRMIASNPAKGVKLPRLQKAAIIPPTQEQVAALAAAVPHRLSALVFLAAATGLRLGELTGLTRDRVDFFHRTVTIDRQLCDVDAEGAPVFGPPKTRTSVRRVPLAPSAVTALSEHLKAYPAEPGELIFRDGQGRPWKRNRFEENWRRARQRAGCPQVRLHDCRHFYASLLIRSGCSVKEVQSCLGHATAAETLDTYSHLWPDSEDRSRAAVEAVLGRALEPSALARVVASEGNGERCPSVSASFPLQSA